jgi:hypothetical protein
MQIKASCMYRKGTFVVLWSPENSIDFLVKDLTGRFTKCDGKRYSSTDRAKRYIDFVIKEYNLDYALDEQVNAEIDAQYPNMEANVFVLEIPVDSPS